MLAVTRFRKFGRITLLTGALSLTLPNVAFAGDDDEVVDCCGPRDSSCCPGKIITGGALGQLAEVSDEVADGINSPSSDHEMLLGKALTLLLNALGYGEGAGGDDSNKSTTSDKIPPAQIEAVHAALASMKVGQTMTGPSGVSGGGKYKVVMKAMAEKPFSRTFMFKASNKSPALIVTYKVVKKGISITWKPPKP